MFLPYKPALFFSLVPFLFSKTLPPFLPMCNASLNPTEGSESGRSTPSLSTFSDGKSPSSTYVPVPRHFHIPGRSARLDRTCPKDFILLTDLQSVREAVCTPWTRSVWFSSVQFGSFQFGSVQICSDCFRLEQEQDKCSTHHLDSTPAPVPHLFSGGQPIGCVLRQLMRDHSRVFVREVETMSPHCASERNLRSEDPF